MVLSGRRDFLKKAGVGAGAVAAGLAPVGATAQKASASDTAGWFSVRHFGATGDGKTLDTPAVNRTIEAASAAGGGTVYFPAGVYLCYSIRLKSSITLHLENAATILAASTPDEGMTTGGYDAAEANEFERYQDFGHNHWHNSLIYGVDLKNIAITGGGLIWGKGLASSSRFGKLMEFHPGVGNKAIGLKNCNNVTLRDISILQGGHFGILATGVDNFTVDNVMIDTQRDGMNIDCCRNVRITNCSVNSPRDDGICPKSSFALGYARPTENVRIANCYVTGSYEVGSMIDGTWRRFPEEKEELRTGRIKFGSESCGGFKNITVTNCVFDGCGGIALESSDGALLEDVIFSNITMRDCCNMPLFMRICARMRAPEGTPIGKIRRVQISNIVSSNSFSDFACLLTGIPDHPIEDIQVSDCFLHHRGGGKAESTKLVPPDEPQRAMDPRRFGPMPSHGFVLRHARNVEFSNVEVAFEKPDARPMFWMLDVDGVDLFRVKQPRSATAPMFHLAGWVREFRVFGSRGVKDTQLESAEQKML